MLAGGGPLIRAPLGSQIGAGPPIMRAHPHSPIMGNSSLLMGGPHRMLHPQHMGPQAPRRPLLFQVGNFEVVIYFLIWLSLAFKSFLNVIEVIT